MSFTDEDKAMIREVAHDTINKRGLVDKGDVENTLNCMIKKNNLVNGNICEMKHKEVESVRKMLIGLIASMIIVIIMGGLNYMRISEAYEVKVKQSQQISKAEIQELLQELKEK